MQTVRKNFRIGEDYAYDLERLAADLGYTETHVIEVALDVFVFSGASDAIKDLKSKGNYGYRDFMRNAYFDGKLRAQLRQNVGLGLS